MAGQASEDQAQLEDSTAHRQVRPTRTHCTHNSPGTGELGGVRNLYGTVLRGGDGVVDDDPAAIPTPWPAARQPIQTLPDAAGETGGVGALELIVIAPAIGVTAMLGGALMTLRRGR